MNTGLDRLFGFIGCELGKSLDAIHRFEWSAPWVSTAVKRQNKCA